MELIQANKKVPAKLLADTSQKAKQAAAQKENPLWAKLYPSVDEKNQFVEGPIVGYANALDTAKVMEYLKVPEVIASFPPDIKFLWGSKSTSDKDPIFHYMLSEKHQILNCRQWMVV